MVFYELYIDQFASNLGGLTDRLPYLEDLGITCVHLLPHYPSPMIDQGYDVSDHCGVRSELGTLDDFKRFTDAAHARGMRVLTDLVLNHVSIRHPWFQEASRGNDSDKHDYFLWSATGREFSGAVNAFPEVKPSNWIWNAATREHYFATFYPEQADLNWHDPRVFEELCSVTSFWVGMGVDAFRLDAVQHLVKEEGTDSMDRPLTHAILKKLRSYLDENHNEVALLAEVHRPLEKAAAYFGDGDECHLVYGFPLMEALYAKLLLNESSLLDTVLPTHLSIPEGAAWATFLANHDNISFEIAPSTLALRLSRALDPAQKRRFGPGSASRLASLWNGDLTQVLAAHELLFSYPGSPIIYYGDEIGMQNAPLPEGEVDTRKVMRGKFDWQEAERQRDDPNSLFFAMRALIRERRNR